MHTKKSLTMNKFYYALILIISLAMFSCKTDIDVNAEYKDIAIVYGIINPTDSVHYLKINKAFLGNASALDLAADATNFNYDDGELDITIEAFDESNTLRASYSTGAGDIARTNEVVKDAGVFDNRDNVLYKFEEKNINRDFTYKVKILNIALDKEITSETKIVGITNVDNGTGGKLNFWNGNQYKNRNISVTSGSDVGRVSMALRFNYTEYYTQASNRDSTVHSLIMPLGQQIATTPLGNESLVLVMQGETFFQNIATGIADKNTVPDFSHRELNNISIDYSAAGTELSTYMEVSAPSSSVNQDKPSYTNIKNGIGVFSSRDNFNAIPAYSSSSSQVNISNNTIEYLATSSLLFNKGFCFGTDGIGNPEAPCQQL